MPDDEVGALPLDPSETSARIRAAKNYCGEIPWSHLAEVTGIGKPTLERMTRVVNPQPARPEQLDAIADATGVPRAFMRLGFSSDATGPPITGIWPAARPWPCCSTGWRRSRRCWPGGWTRTRSARTPTCSRHGPIRHSTTKSLSEPLIRRRRPARWRVDGESREQPVGQVALEPDQPVGERLARRREHGQRMAHGLQHGVGAGPHPDPERGVDQRVFAGDAGVAVDQLGGVFGGGDAGGLGVWRAADAVDDGLGAVGDRQVALVGGVAPVADELGGEVDAGDEGVVVELRQRNGKMHALSPYSLGGRVAAALVAPCALPASPGLWDVRGCIATGTVPV